MPGTVAMALHDCGALEAGESSDLDFRDWWFRTTFDARRAEAGEEVCLLLDGLATVADVYLNGERLLESSSMFSRHRIDIGGRLHERNELAIRFRALGPLLRPRRRPRARWRTRLVADGNLRFFRTMLLGRTPGFAPGPPAIGPWRPIWIERRRHVTLDEVDLRTRLDGRAGVLVVRATLRALADAPVGPVEVELSGPSGMHRAALALKQDGDLWIGQAELRVDEVAPWWPHTHGDPVMHDVRLLVDSVELDLRRVGFRRLAPGRSADHDVEAGGLDLHVNEERIFCRGAVWTPVDPIGLAPDTQTLRAALERVRNAGMNMLRLPGTGAYESSDFHDLCDELGVLVWQDFMFANMDYPIEDADFCELVRTEVRGVLATLGHRPSLAVLCGNSEIEQQVAMLGLDSKLGRGELFGEILPSLVHEAEVDAIYVPSAPCGGDLPFRTDTGVANYYGVGAYRRPLADARHAGVRFAAECLAFSNVPGESALEEAFPHTHTAAVVHHPRWKAGVPRDVGAGWDFEDVRDHYLELLFALDPAELRRVDHDRYLDLSRAVSGEVMAEVFGEWRRATSPCGGGLVLWLRDLCPGAGWGLVDHRGEPKVAYHHLRRALAPVALWTTDEGLNGVVVHVANDRQVTLDARLRIALYRDLEVPVAEAKTDVRLAPHGAEQHNLETILGRFVDVGWTYRFGPAAQDLIVASLERDVDGGGTELLSQSMRFPTGRPTSTESAAGLGLEAEVRHNTEGSIFLTVRSQRLAYGVRVEVPGFEPSDDAFSVEPGRERLVQLRERASDASFAGGSLTALNLRGRVRIAPLEVPA
ncbi:MAG: glycoside hydrolase family 2 protein [Thermoleophilaceae bacterium]